jgi:hypothetical protein
MTTHQQPITSRRRIEAALQELGAERHRLENETDRIDQRIRALLKPARQADITVRDISSMTGLSTQTLHTWHRELMQPIPAVHLGRIGPPPQDLVEATLRTMGEEPDREWNAIDVRASIPPEWPTGSTHQVQLALGSLSRSLQIWQTESGYRITPPPAATDAATPTLLEILQRTLDELGREYAARKADAATVLAAVEKLLPRGFAASARAAGDDRCVFVQSEDGNDVPSNLKRRIERVAQQHGYETLFTYAGNYRQRGRDARRCAAACQSSTDQRTPTRGSTDYGEADSTAAAERRPLGRAILIAGLGSR